ncbi:MAG: type I DNA topoisomerase [Candidatus Paceibacterota bacterium]|nr:MAG: type I DNA topoisomerase [Candidatus Paceibacterota bacterium]
MTTTLVIVESPAKEKTISKYLGKGYTVKASIGHIRDLPKSNKKAIDIEAGFVPHYEISPGKERVVAEIKNSARKADEILLATDPDREGEAIAWHISKAADLKNPKRIVFYEITKDAVLEALKHPRKIDINLKEAQEARRVLDRLVGYDLSGLIWKKVRYGLSAGRVQSPALRIIMEREREIRAFESHKFWVITADVLNKNKEPLTLTCSEEPTDFQEVQRILENGKVAKWRVKEVKESEAKRSPRAPFITSTLQQTASSRLGFSPAKTMSVAQKLYEAGLITYMRTDSTNLSSSAQAQIAKIINEKYGKDYFSPRNYKTKSKSAQEAHEAIRPSDASKEMAGQNEDQKKLYRLIWQRTVSSQMSDAKILRSKITAKTTESDIPEFYATGSRIIFDGWLKVDSAAKGEDLILPKVSEGEELFLQEIKTEEKETQPPSRYTEAGLIKELEKRGIGRPSTYASIIKTIQDRGYVEKRPETGGKALFPTDTGDVVSTFLEENFTQYVSDTFTAEMEDKLDLVAQGKLKYEEILGDFYKPFLKEVKSKEKMEKITNLGKADAKLKCPKCKSPMIIKLSKSGKFLSCEKFPECSGARTIEGEELQGPKETGEDCPECSKGRLIERDGRYGRFVSCNRYPKCKFIKKDPEAEKKASTGVKCPECNSPDGGGELTEKRGRFGVFYACTNYPKCKFTIKSKPTGEICKLCGSLMMEGTKTIPERCSDKNCPNHNPHKLNK